MIDSDLVPGKCQFPSFPHDGKSLEVLQYLVDATTFALSVLDRWWHCADVIGFPDHELAELEEVGRANATKVGELMNNVQPNKTLAECEAVVTAAAITHEALERFCAYGLRLLGGLLHEGVRTPDNLELQFCCHDTEEELRDLLCATMELHEQRGYLLDDVRLSEEDAAA